MYQTTFLLPSYAPPHLKEDCRRMRTFTKTTPTFLLMLSTKAMQSRCRSINWNALMGTFWYLPHHGVYHPQKGSLPVVFEEGLEKLGLVDIWRLLHLNEKDFTFFRIPTQGILGLFTSCCLAI